MISCVTKKNIKITLYTAVVPLVFDLQLYKTTHWTANFTRMRKKWFKKDILLTKTDLGTI